DDALTARVFDVSIDDVPLRRHGPVEDLRTAWYFMNIQRNVLADESQRLTDAVPGNAAADRVQRRDEVVHLSAEVRAFQHGSEVSQHHGLQAPCITPRCSTRRALVWIAGGCVR